MRWTALRERANGEIMAKAAARAYILAGEPLWTTTTSSTTHTQTRNVHVCVCVRVCMSCEIKQMRKHKAHVPLYVCARVCVHLQPQSEKKIYNKSMSNLLCINNIITNEYCKTHLTKAETVTSLELGK